MQFWKKIECWLIGAPEECGIHDPKMIPRYVQTLKRVFALGFITGAAVLFALQKYVTS